MTEKHNGPNTWVRDLIGKWFADVGTYANDDIGRAKAAAVGKCAKELLLASREKS